MKKNIEYGFQKVIIPKRFFKNILENGEEVSDLDISEILEKMRQLGEDISRGPIEAWEYTENGDIEVYIEA